MPGGIEVTGGGSPTPDQLAAIVAALDTVAESAADAVPTMPAWSQAALLEGVGAPPIAAPSDLERSPTRGTAAS